MARTSVAVASAGRRNPIAPTAQSASAAVRRLPLSERAMRSRKPTWPSRYRAGPPTTAPAPGRELLPRVRDHELVADGGDDDPGDHRDMEVGVGVAGQSPAVVGRVEPDLGNTGDVVEVQPPERGRREERDGNGRPPRERRCRDLTPSARDDDRLAERDDHEELEALGEMGALDLPIGRWTPPEPGAQYPAYGPA